MVKADLNWLFLNLTPTWTPQTGGADANKKAVWWWPGKRQHTPIPTPFYGCTQLSFPGPSPVLPTTPCMIHWLGIDIDLDDPPTLEQVTHLVTLPDPTNPAVCLPLSIRRSSGGAGLHLIIRLSTPIITHYQSSQTIIRALLAPVVRLIEDMGIPVCSADRRMFWLWGGKNEWLVRRDQTWSPQAPAPQTEVTVTPLPGEHQPPEKLDPSNFPPALEPFLTRAIQAGVLHQPVSHNNRIHIGTFIRFLQAEGVKPPATRSPCGPEWHVNGFLDIQGNQVTVYSFADSQVIWSFEPVDSVLDTLKGFA